MVDQGHWQGRELDGLYLARLVFGFPEDPVLREHYPMVPPFDDVEPQALPPSGTYGSGNSIEHYLETCLTVVDGTKRMVRKIKKNVDFTPTREPQAMDIPRSTIPDHVDFMDAAGPTGQSQITSNLDYPTVVAQREPFDLSLILKSSPSPDLFLHSWTVQLVESTYASVSDTLKESWMTDHTLGSEVHINDFDARPLINVSPKTVLENLTVPATCAVSFNTPNLQRTYSLRVIVMLHCCGQPQEMLYNTGHVTLLGAELGSESAERESDEVYDPDMDGFREMFQGRLVPSLYVRHYRHG